MNARRQELEWKSDDEAGTRQARAAGKAPQADWSYESVSEDADAPCGLRGMKRERFSRNDHHPRSDPND